MGPPPFQRFLDRHREEVYRFLAGMLPRHEVDDCFQETFLAALRAYPRVRADSDLRAWVLTIASRKAVDAHRARARRPVPMDYLPDGPVEQARGDDGLWDLVRALPGKQRAAIVHRYAGDLPYREIARLLACSEEAARQSVRQGTKRLKEWIDEGSRAGAGG